MVAIFLKRMAPKLRRWLKSLINYLHLQLFLTLCSWPILLSWGLPLSTASIIGNFIFAPFLTLFLLLSSIIFFLELLFIPAAPFISMLEWLSLLWERVLSLGNRSWLLSFAQPPLIITLLILLGALAILHYKKFLSPVKSSLALCLYTIIMAYMLKATIPAQQEFRVPCFDNELTIIANNGHTTLIDPGCLGRRISAPTFVKYTLIPTLIKRGITHIDKLIIGKPGATVFKATACFVEDFVVKEIYLPKFKGKLKNSGWSSWEKLLIACMAQCTFLHLIDSAESLQRRALHATLSKKGTV